MTRPAITRLRYLPLAAILLLGGCGAPPAQGADVVSAYSGCTCSGTGIGGVPITTDCGTRACRSDDNTYWCTESGWSLANLGCGMDEPCSCSGSRVVPGSASCGSDSCGIDGNSYWCSALGWSFAFSGCPQSEPKPPAPKFPASEFAFGFTTAYSTPFGEPIVFGLSDTQLAVLRDQIGVNVVRFFVHPNLVGLPQKTWNGPEAFKYSAYQPSQYVWNRPETTAVDSLDEIVGKLYAAGIEPMLQPMLPDEAINWIYEPDLSFLNAAKGVDYSGYVPADEVQSFVVALAAHVQERFGKPFLMNLPEICGQNSIGPVLRGGEQAAWARIRDAVAAVAPLAEFHGPEVCTNNNWGWTEAQDGCGVFSPIVDRVDAPPMDLFSRYAATFGVFEASGGLIGQQQVAEVCPKLNRLRASTDQHAFITRDQALPNKWMLAETSWASMSDLDEQHLNWAAFLFGLDHSRGMLVWDAKTGTSEAGTNPERNGLWDVHDVPTSALNDWTQLGPIIGSERSFFSTYHERINGDRLPANGGFRETDPLVITRVLDHHLVLFATQATSGVTLDDSSFSGHRWLRPIYTGGAGSSKPTMRVVPGSAGRANIRIGNLTPHRIYIFEIVGW